jgi:hypothetical protein
VAGETIVFFPKYTTLCGTATFTSDPYEVTGYKTLTVETLLVAVVGGGVPVVNASLEGSSDMITWTPIDGPDALSAGTINNFSVTSPPRYVRVVIVTTGGTTMSATLWSKGVARDS